MTEVLLGQGYFQRFDPKLEAAGQPYPPLGTLIAAACLRDAGHQVGLFDSMLATSPREWDDALGRLRPRVAVVYEDSFNYLSKMCLGRMREASFSMLESAARARLRHPGVGHRMRPTMTRSTSRMARRRSSAAKGKPRWARPSRCWRRVAWGPFAPSRAWHFSTSAAPWCARRRGRS